LQAEKVGEFPLASLRADAHSGVVRSTSSRVLAFVAAAVLGLLCLVLEQASMNTPVSWRLLIEAPITLGMVSMAAAFTILADQMHELMYSRLHPWFRTVLVTVLGYGGAWLFVFSGWIEHATPIAAWGIAVGTMAGLDRR
ncbi:MAG: hypothetical protein QMC79_10235, partial [Anaerosomatales bacterium]|nr:hypothetical protein [Anaerosomatales bacterium]